MDNLKSYKTLVVMAIVCLLFGAILGAYVGLNNGWKLGQEKAAKDLEMNRQEAEKEALKEVNPFEQTANPFEKSPVNPFENIKTNPFE